MRRFTDPIISISLQKIIPWIVVCMIGVLATGTGWWVRDQLADSRSTADEAVQVARNIEKEIIRLSTLMAGVREDLQVMKEHDKRISGLELRITVIEERLRKADKR